MHNESQFWAIDPRRFQSMSLAIQQGERPVSHTEFAATHGRRAGRTGRSVGVLRLFGVLTQRGSRRFGGTSTEAFGRKFGEMVNNPNVSQVVLEIDSPGGSVAGTRELANKIFRARGSKPITSVINGLGASAAFWIGAAADRIVASPSADVGSVGIFLLHEDASKALEMAGVKLNFIHAGKHKVEGNFTQPLSDAARQHIQSRVNEMHAEFIADLAKFRGVSRTQVQFRFGQGRVLRAKDAKAAGMIDSITTFDNLLENIGVSTASVQANIASNDTAQLRRRLNRMNLN